MPGCQTIGAQHLFMKWRSLDLYTAMPQLVQPDVLVSEVASCYHMACAAPSLSAKAAQSTDCIIHLAGHHFVLSKGKLLAALPFEVRVHILWPTLGVTTGCEALLRHWLNLALVSQDLPESLQSVV